MLLFPWNWWPRRPERSLKHLRVVFYTRRGCHLCEDAWELLRAEQQTYGFRLEAVDVDTVPELAARYGEMVPVVAVDDRVRFWGRINRVLLSRFLTAETRKKGGATTDPSPGP